MTPEASIRLNHPGDPEDKEIVIRIRSIGAAEVARRAGLFPTTVRDWLRGRSCMTLPNANKVLAVIDMGPYRCDLVREEEPPK